MKENINIEENLATGFNANISPQDTIVLGRAEATIEHRSADGTLLSREVVHNLITNVGRVYYHTQCFATSGIGANGLNWIALSADAVSETASSTTLSNEIVANGLSRAQGSVSLPTGSGNQTTISKVFTATGTQSAQKMALFNAASSGTMNHVLGFTQRSLISGDTLTVSIVLSLG